MFKQIALVCCIILMLTCIVASDPLDGIVFNSFLPVLIKTKGSLGVTLQLRCIKLLSQVRFEALCVYHPTCKAKVLNGAVRRPAVEHTVRNQNIAIAHALYHLIIDLTPEFKADVDVIMKGLGLDPSNKSEDLSSPVGVGNYVARKTIEVYHHDGINQLGDVGGVEYNRMNYSDYTKYEPKNQHYKIVDPDAWQPLVMVGDKKRPVIQAYLTPQIEHMETLVDLSHIKVNPQVDRWDEHPIDYVQKTKHVMKVQTKITEEQKLKAEFFDNKALGFRLLGDHIVEKFGNHSLYFHTVFNMIVNTAAGDIFPPIWHLKTKYDAVRPFTSIHFLYGNKTIKGWGGPGKGIVKLKGSEWQSYLPTDAFPDYPSGTACFCAAWVEAAKLFLNRNDIDFTWTVPAGKSMIEPGFTPVQAFDVKFDTLDQAAHECMLSRVWAGVHYMQAVTESNRVCKPIGKLVYDKVMAMLKGH